jgi:hypothetical protein
MTHFKIVVAGVLTLSFLVAAEYPALAAPTKCNAELRKCNSHCNLVYESKRANRVCRDRCKDALYVCKTRPT